MKRAFFLSLILMSLPLVAAARDNSHAERHYQGDIHRGDDNRRHNHGSRSHWGLYWGVNNPWLSPWRYDPWNRWQWMILGTEIAGSAPMYIAGNPSRSLW